MALVSRPVIFLQMLAASAVDVGANSLITVFNPAHIQQQNIPSMIFSNNYWGKQYPTHSSRLQTSFQH